MLFKLIFVQNSQDETIESKELGFREGQDTQYILDEMAGRIIDPTKDYVSDKKKKEFREIIAA